MEDLKKKIKYHLSGMSFSRPRVHHWSLQKVFLFIDCVLH